MLDLGSINVGAKLPVFVDPNNEKNMPPEPVRVLEYGSDVDSSPVPQVFQTGSPIRTNSKASAKR
jgi:hypothetical protein